MESVQSSFSKAETLAFDVDSSAEETIAAYEEFYIERSKAAEEIRSKTPFSFSLFGLFMTAAQIEEELDLLYSLDMTEGAASLLNANQSPLEDVVVKEESDDVEFENDRIVFSSINEDEYVSLGGRFERKEFVEYNPQSRRAISFYLPDGAEKGSITIDLLVVDRLGNEMKYSVDIVI